MLSIENKKKYILQIILCFISFIFISLNFIYSYDSSNSIKSILSTFFNFIQQLYIFLFLIMLLLINKNKINFLNNNKIISYLMFIFFVNIVIGIFILPDVISKNSLNLISRKFSANNISYLWNSIFIIECILGYILIPIVFVYFYFKYYSNYIMDFQKVWLVFIFPFFYFMINFLIYYFSHDFSVSGYKVFISPESKNGLQLFFIFLQIIIAYLLFSLFTIFIIKNNFSNFFKALLFLLLLLLMPFIFYNRYDFKHVYFSLFNSQIQGATLFVESQYIADSLSNITEKTKSELSSNGEKILEFGAGTGNITKFLVDKYGEENIIAIEINEDACKKLKERFPKMTVISQSVDQLKKILSEENIEFNKIKGIVSTLPISLLEQNEIDSLTEVVKEIMQKSSTDKETVYYKEYRYNMFDMNSHDKKMLVDRLTENNDNFQLDKQYAFTSHFVPLVINICYYKHNDVSKGSSSSSVSVDSSSVISSFASNLNSINTSKESLVSYFSDSKELGSNSSLPSSHYYVEIDKNFSFMDDYDTINNSHNNSVNSVNSKEVIDNTILASKNNLLNLSTEVLSVLQNTKKKNNLSNKFKKFIKKIIKK